MISYDNSNPKPPAFSGETTSRSFEIESSLCNQQLWALCWRDCGIG
jgi:hypothetical protein